LGGVGVAFAASGANLTNSGWVSGGRGGAGGAPGGGGGGSGGDGGAGVLFAARGATFTNSGRVTGGAGGWGGSFGSNGAGGAGVVGFGLAVINSGAIAGLGGDGVTRAVAIDFSGGVNSLTLGAGAKITGLVVAFSVADTLALGGTANSAFNVSSVGSSAQYQGFGVFKKTGSSAWTLTGVTSAKGQFRVRHRVRYAIVLFLAVGPLAPTKGWVKN
jgi:fibronectin-binding autotransporter adhesin